MAASLFHICEFDRNYEGPEVLIRRFNGDDRLRYRAVRQCQRLLDRTQLPGEFIKQNYRMHVRTKRPARTGSGLT
jgi:hypothetical protein